LGHGADYLTSPPKEGMLMIFTREKSNGFGQHANHQTTEAVVGEVTVMRKFRKSVIKMNNKK
jgi:hypothetical protein